MDALMEKLDRMKSWSCWLAVMILCALATVLGLAVSTAGYSQSAIVLVYVTGVLFSSILTRGYVYGVASAFISTLLFNFFFTKPYYTLYVSDPANLITFVFMTLTALTGSTLVSMTKESALKAARQEKAASTLYQLASRLNAAGNMEEISKAAASALEAVPGIHASLHLDPEQKTALDQAEKDGSHIYPVESGGQLLGTVVMDRDTQDEIQQEILQATLENTALAAGRYYALEKEMRSEEEARTVRLKSSLLRSISHDLRTPLAAIEGSAWMLMESTQPDSFDYKTAHDIYHEASWLHAMVENILNLTKIQEGRLEITAEKIPAEEILESALSHIESLHIQRQFRFSLPEHILMIPADASLLAQVLQNLILNAVEHTKEGGLIEISIAQEENQAVIRVMNDEPDIPPSELPHLFEMFYTRPHKAADAKRGNGLGLAICEAIVKAHHGSIRAYNRGDQQGVCFEVRLPLDEEALKREREGNESGSKS